MNIYVFVEGKAGQRPIVSASERLFMSLSKRVPGVGAMEQQKPDWRPRGNGAKTELRVYKGSYSRSWYLQSDNEWKCFLSALYGGDIA